MKPTIRQLQKKLKESEEQRQQYLSRIAILSKENENLRKQLQTRLDATMLQQRIQLATQLAQLVEATSKAIMFIVAKEAI